MNRDVGKYKESFGELKRSHQLPANIPQKNSAYLRAFSVYLCVTSPNLPSRFLSGGCL